MLSAEAQRALAAIDLESRHFALISDDEVYRYWLHRSWFTGTGWCVFVMLNPSSADGRSNDPTTRRCIQFAQVWGFKGCVLVNLYAARTKDPKTLNKFDDPVGPLNDFFIEAACSIGSTVVVAWGQDEMIHRRVNPVLAIARASRAKPKHLGLSKEGFPRHPLYVPAHIELAPYNGNR